MSVANSSLWVFSVFVGVLAIAGCGAEVGDAQGELRVEDERARSVEPLGTLTIVDADEVRGVLVATYALNERQITFEMRLGGPMALPPAETERNVPRSMIDVRVLDREGRPVYMQMAGDEFLDPSWTRPVLAELDEVTRENDFGLIRAAAAEFATAQLPASFEDLRLNALQLAALVSELSAKPDAMFEPMPGSVPDPVPGSASGPVPGSVSGPVSDAVPGSASEPVTETVQDASSTGRRLRATWVVGGAAVAYWDYRIYRKPAFFRGSPFEHSAVQLRGWNAAKNSVLFAATSCNHGACAGAAPMAIKCTMPGWLSDDGTHTRFFYNEQATTTAITSGCSTEYSAIFDNGHHVCNDDTVLQIHAIKFDSFYDRAIGATGECSDNVGNYWAPDCI